jgi:DUF438 domain-containing protein
MRLNAKTKIDNLLKRYPFLEDFLAGLSSKFSKLKSPIMRKTIGKVATLQQIASFGDFPLRELLEKIRAEVKRVTKEDVDLELGEGEPEPIAGKEARLEVLKDIIRELHKGGSLEEQKRRFAELVKDTSATEISEMEQKLIEEGMPEDEVKRLCDVHVQVFKESLEAKSRPSSIPGHPLHTLMEENKALEGLLTRWKELLAKIAVADGGESFKRSKDELRAYWDKLAEVEKHYLKKENQLFPLLEAKGVSGPSKVMWAIHDDIRAQLREFRQLLSEERSSEIVSLGRKLGEAMADMVYKEQKILFPMSQETLDEKDWAAVKRGEEEIGYAWIRPGTDWKPSVKVEEIPALPQERESPGPLDLDTGALTPAQVNLLLKNLPVDVTFVDEMDRVLYYSATAERIFPRSAAIIGRKVQKCHPPASVHVVNRILESFREGRRDVAEFWIEMRGRFIHIRYFAVRDENKKYKGCLEVSQDVTAIRGLKGEKRLLEWEGIKLT